MLITELCTSTCALHQLATYMTSSASCFLGGCGGAPAPHGHQAPIWGRIAAHCPASARCPHRQLSLGRRRRRALLCRGIIHPCWAVLLLRGALLLPAARLLPGARLACSTLP